MPIPILAAIAAGAALGLAKNRMAAAQAADERKRQAAIARYSPWTGMQAHSVQDPNMFGDILQGGASGAMLGGGYNAMTAAPAAAGGTAAAAEGASAAGGSAASGAGAGTAGAGYSLLGPGKNANAGFSLMGDGGMNAASKFKLDGMGDMDLAAGNSPWMKMDPNAVNGGLFQSYYGGYGSQFASK